MNRYIPIVLCLNTVIFLFTEQSMAQSSDGILDNSSEGSFTLTLKVIKSSLKGFINSGGNSNTRAERAQVVLSSGPPGLSRPRNNSNNGLGNLMQILSQKTLKQIMTPMIKIVATKTTCLQKLKINKLSLKKSH